MFKRFLRWLYPPPCMEDFVEELIASRGAQWGRGVTGTWAPGKSLVVESDDRTCRHAYSPQELEAMYAEKYGP